MPSFASWSGFTQKPHRVLAGAEDLHVANSRHARQLIDQIDVGVVGEKNVRRRCPSANTSAISISGAVVDFLTVTP